MTEMKRTALDRRPFHVGLVLGSERQASVYLPCSAADRSAGDVGKLPRTDGIIAGLPEAGVVENIL